MAARINYEDDIFFVSALIKALSTAVGLEIDSEFFEQKVLDDVSFVHSTLTRLHHSLRDNVYLIRRTEYMRSLLRTVHSFVEFLDTASRKETPFTKSLAEASGSLARFRAEQQQAAIELQRALQGATSTVGETEDIISQDEYRFLFEEQSAE